ncbi:hypothetical protein [Brevibacillus sp. SYSU BS000544]|uniref:hypothetical protein n=1 Tax=Brevibacillus sp. SYSU BS000544 TaxID=3416443 RepID=UPI003CE4CFDD
MQLRVKSLSGVIQPLSYVDKTLRQQGFRRMGSDDTPVYDVVIYDSATSTSYFLRIPTSISHHNFSGKGELTVKIGRPYLESKFVLEGNSEEFIIPQAIRHAAEHKLAEIADYLVSPS